MKFSCDRCQTRYSIGDDKVQGKVLKIRCKTCGNIIVVRESTAATQQMQGAHASSQQSLASAAAFGGGALSASGGAAFGAALASSAPAGATGPLPPVPQGASTRGEVEWFVAIKGKQHGPARQDDIARLFREGKITERTHLWHEAMAAWTRLKDVPEMQALMREPIARKPPPPPPEEGAEIVSFEQARAQRLLQQGHQPPAAAAHDPFAAVAAVGSAEAPRDSTRVFIMQAGLHNRGQKHKLYASVAAAVVATLGAALVLDYKGIVAIPGLHSVLNVVTQRESAPAVAPVVVAWATGEEDPELKCKLMPNPEECKKQVIAENEVKRRARPAGTGPSAAAIAAGFQNGAPGTDDPLRAGSTAPGGFADVSNPTRAGAIAAIFGNDQKGGPKVPVSKVETPTVAGGNIDAENVVKVVKDGAGAVQQCVEREAKNGNLPSGKQKLVVTVQPRGTVDKVTFANGAVAASPVGECIRGAAKRWKFAPFVGDATDIEIPLILSVN